MNDDSRLVNTEPNPAKAGGREAIGALPPEDGALAVQVAPFGEYPARAGHGDGGRTVVQVLDAAAFARIIDDWAARGRPEILVDADHDSIGGGTRAYAWASNLRTDPVRGLVADFRLTDLGRAAVAGREYRFVSPVFLLEEGTDRVLALDSVALTNRPNLPVSCVLNRRGTDNKTVEDQKGKNKMDKILSALGLAPDATEEDALAAIEALRRDADEARAQALANEAAACADQNRDRIANRDEFVRLYVANGRDTALAFLAAVKAPGAPTRIAANSARTPADAPDVRSRLAACRTPEELAAFAVANARELAEAH